MPAVSAIRERVVDVSRRYSRVADEVEDLAHDLIVSVLDRGRSLDDDGFLRALHGAARRHAAFLARTAGRRRRREAIAGETMSAGSDPDPYENASGAPLSALSPALRTTLLLLVQGLDKAELRSVLGISDAALRKRFQALRERAPLERPAVEVTPRSPVLSRLRAAQVRLLPRLARAHRGERMLAVGDPDGHGIHFVGVLTEPEAAATPGEPAPSSRAGR